MKKYFTAFSMTQSMFCHIPFPIKEWDEKSRPYMLLFLPLVGLEIGVLWLLAHRVMVLLNLPRYIYAFAMTTVPFLLAGFIHLDGFMDVCDAVGSYRTLEKRREILKDSHVGSCAVVWCALLFLGFFAGFASVENSTDIYVLALVPVLSRVCSALAITNLKSMSTSQYANSHTTPFWHSVVLIIVAVCCFAAAYYISAAAVCCLAVQAAAYAYSLFKSYKTLQGMNGDISGYCITVSELFAVIALAIF